MSTLFSIVLVTAFLLWALYRLVIKRDLRNHLNEFYPGLFFCFVWGMIYWWLLS